MPALVREEGEKEEKRRGKPTLEMLITLEVDARFGEGLDEDLVKHGELPIHLQL